MASRGELLTGFREAIASGEWETFSWGPFTGQVTLRNLYYKGGDATGTRTSAGLFVAGDAGFPVGLNPFEIPPGWRRLHRPAESTAGNDDQRRGLDLPFQPDAGSAALQIDTGGLIITGSLFWLKALVQNRTAGGMNVHLALTIDIADPPPDVTIDPRPIPGPLPPPGPIPPPGGPPGPTPGPVPEPGPGPLPGPGPTPAPLPLPGPGAFGPIDLDPEDPLTAARARCADNA